MNELDLFVRIEIEMWVLVLAAIGVVGLLVLAIGQAIGNVVLKIRLNALEKAIDALNGRRR